MNFLIFPFAIIFQSSFFLLGHEYLMTALELPGSLIILKISQVSMGPKSSLITPYGFACHFRCPEQSDMDK